MLLIVSIILIGVLLAAIVYGLHSNQKRETEETVDRIIPLPPLDPGKSALERLGATATMESEGFVTKTASPTISTHTAGHKDSWLELARTLADAGDIEGALYVCAEKYPQMGAFKQVTVLLRRHIREQKQAKHDTGDSLQHLYEVAAAADYWHGKHPELTRPAPRMLKRVDPADWRTLDFPYQQIGYSKLSLLTSADVASIVAAWGEPKQHQPVRQYHEQHWRILLKKTGV
jgi:hypothetical protein